MTEGRKTHGRVRKRLVLTAVAALTLTAPAFSYPSSVAGKLQWIESRTGYVVDYRNIPSIRYVNPRVMAAFPMAKRPGVVGSVMAVFQPEHNTILIDERLSARRHQDYAATVLVHELVHYVQHRNGTLQGNCSVELEAYALQRQFAKEHGIDTRHINVENGQALRQTCETQWRVREDAIRRLRG